MPYCPQCRDEFQDWVKDCPDCNVALVKTLPSPPTKYKRDESEPVGQWNISTVKGWNLVALTVVTVLLFGLTFILGAAIRETFQGSCICLLRSDQK